MPMKYRSPTHTSWVQMRSRCQNVNHDAFARYGGRGIKVCERWQVFENFLADMGERPPGMTLDRFPDVNGNYEPGNCRWATPTEQGLNRRDVPCAVAVALMRHMRRRGSRAKDLQHAFGVSAMTVTKYTRQVSR